MILVDTNVWSEPTKKNADPRVDDWLVKYDEVLILSPIVLTEIRSGIAGMPNSRKRAVLSNWLKAIEDNFSSTMLDFDAAAAVVAGGLIAQRKLIKQETKLFDVLLAAQGIAHDLPVATRNLKDFEWTGVALIDPWAG